MIISKVYQPLRRNCSAQLGLAAQVLQDRKESRERSGSFSRVRRKKPGSKNIKKTLIVSEGPRGL